MPRNLKGRKALGKLMGCDICSPVQRCPYSMFR